MKLERGKDEYKLKEAPWHVVAVGWIRPDAITQPMTLMRPEEILEARKRCTIGMPGAVPMGVPLYCALLEYDRLVVFPIPDKAYEVKIRYTVLREE